MNTVFSYSLLLTITIANSWCTVGAEAFLSFTSCTSSCQNGIRFRGGWGDGSRSGDEGEDRWKVRVESGLENKSIIGLRQGKSHKKFFCDYVDGEYDDGISPMSSSSASIPSASAVVSSSASSSSPSKGAAFIPPVFKKTKQETLFIENILQSNFLFHDFFAANIMKKEQKNKNKNTGYFSHHKSSVGSDSDSIYDKDLDMSKVASAFEEVLFSVDSLLCRQGDFSNTDYLYIIYSGECSVHIDGHQLEEPFGTMTKGALIGELAMIHETSRQATVKATTEVKVYRLHRKSFHYFLNSKVNANNANIEEKEEMDNTSLLSPKERMQKEIKDIDLVIDQISGVKTRYGGNIIPPFKPMRKWLWSRWKGTILQHAWRTACLNMSMVVIFQFLFRFICTNIINQPITWSIGMIPDQSHPIIARMAGLNELWNLCLALTTFTLTFFLNEALSLWRDIYTKGHGVQRKLSDISFLVASRAKRDPKTKRYTPESSKALEDVAGCIRLFNALLWASYTGRFAILLTPKGLSRMLSRGVMTRKQYECLVRDNNRDTVTTTTLQWIYIRLIQGINDDVFPQSDTFESFCSQTLLDLNAVMGGIGDSLDAKIPLVYVQFVQVLVDVFLLLSPFALYCKLGIWSIPAVGLLNIFYGGMLDLAKILLFPLESKSDFYKDKSVNMDVGVLIRESNVGSKQWKSGVETLPF